MNLNCGNVGVAGYYTFELNGVKVFESPSKNLITDFGWNRLFNLVNIGVSGSALQVGTGNTTPAPSDTALAAFLAQKVGSGTGVTGTGSDGVGNYTYTRWPYAFAQGAVIGNVAEVGWKVASADAALTSRALTKDGLGNPAVIVVTAIDQLTVNFELRYYRATIDTTGGVTVAGVPTTYTLRTGAPVEGTALAEYLIGGLTPSATTLAHYGTGSVLGAADGGPPSGTSTTALAEVAISGLSANPATGVISFTTGVVPTGSGNSSGGVVNILLTPSGGGNVQSGAYGNIKVGFSPAIPKDNTKTVSYTFSFTFTRL